MNAVEIFFAFWTPYWYVLPLVMTLIVTYCYAQDVRVRFSLGWSAGEAITTAPWQPAVIVAAFTWVLVLWGRFTA